MEIKDIRERMKLNGSLMEELEDLDDQIASEIIKDTVNWNRKGNKIRTYSIDYGWVPFGPIYPDRIEKSLALAFVYSGDCWGERSGLGFAIPLETVKQELLQHRFRLPLTRLKPTDGKKFGLGALPGEMKFLPGKLFDLRAGAPMMAIQRGSWPAVLTTKNLTEATHVYLEVKAAKERKDQVLEKLKRPDVMYRRWLEIPDRPSVTFSVLLAKVLNQYLCQ